MMPCDGWGCHVRDAQEEGAGCNIYLSDGYVSLVLDGVVGLPCTGPVVLHPSL